MSLIFVSGAARSGKSTWAEACALSLAAGRAPLVYIATAQVYDEEMRKRVSLHQAARKDKGFETIEHLTDVGGLASSLPSDCTVLLECLGTLLANEMFGTDETPVELSPVDFYVRKIFADVSLLNSSSANLLVVSNDIFSDGITYDEPTETYRHTLGALHVKLAAEADLAVECAAGIPRFARRKTEAC